MRALMRSRTPPHPPPAAWAELKGGGYGKLLRSLLKAPVGFLPETFALVTLLNWNVKRGFHFNFGEEIKFGLKSIPKAGLVRN